jgi:CDP-diacylglycerol--serine O-phosphatidyltransferase
MSSINGNFKAACFAILLAFLFDGLDGKIARLLNATSDFGKQLDSLVDAVSFGVAPAILFYTFVISAYSSYNWIAPLLFTSCAILRLARFNITSKEINEIYFIGLPTPIAAVTIIAFILYINDKTFLDHHFIYFTMMFMVYFLSFLMISRIHYFSLKKIEHIVFKKAVLVLIMAICIVTFCILNKFIMFLCCLSYIFSGLLHSFISRRIALENREYRS